MWGGGWAADPPHRQPVRPILILTPLMKVYPPQSPSPTKLLGTAAVWPRIEQRAVRTQAALPQTRSSGPPSIIFETRAL